MQALTVAAPLVPDLYPQLSAGLAGAAAVAAAGVAAAISALLLPAEQRGIARLGSLTGPEQELEALLSGRGAVRGTLAGAAGALGLGAAGLTLVDALGDAGQMLTVILWSVSGLVAVAYAARREWVVPQLAGGGLLVATLGKAAGYDWPELGANQGAAELLSPAPPSYSPAGSCAPCPRARSRSRQCPRWLRPLRSSRRRSRSTS